ncbi:STAS-like domain-containing protein [Anaerocolumna sp. MB42-C2]|uniref:STAS-like domain-containing protein n=1 Tax=Anaerocolumna sp. MB42-C2 TaxID=3070997 RepID=UPI0027E0F213|nr:STAS-like domain-containing protein [Anaerocolumna sp. MB42-C2]WMJ88880.1 STAS-like domain-containing protein [Anaerocolumna sp. MB42-C2]
MINIKIAQDFSDAPGGRTIKEGPFSGEEFRKNFLKPKYIEAKDTNQKLSIDFDGAFGYSTSFLEESFGGLVRELRTKGILNNIEIISKEDFSLKNDIEKYVSKAEKEL